MGPGPRFFLPLVRPIHLYPVRPLQRVRPRHRRPARHLPTRGPMPPTRAADDIRELDAPARRRARLPHLRRRGLGTRTARGRCECLIDREGGVDLDGRSRPRRRPISSALDRSPAVTQSINGPVPPRGQQPGASNGRCGARNASGARSEQRSRSHITPKRAPERVRGASSSRPATITAPSKVNGTHGAHPVRRRHQGAHRVRVGTAAASRRQEG